MSHAIPPIIVAIVSSSCLLALVQAGDANAGSAGAGVGTGPGSAGSSAPSGMGTSAGNAAGPSAPAGMGTKDTAAGGDLGTNSQPTNPNVQPATPARSRAAAQAARNAGVGHAQNGLPIGAIGSGTSNEDQTATGSASSQNRFRPATQAQGNTGVGSVRLSGRGSSLSDQRAARVGDKVLDAKAQVERRTTVSRKRVTSPIGPGL